MKDPFIIQDFMNFLDQSPTAYHAVSGVCHKLLQCGFLQLSEQNYWDIQPEQRYVVTRDGSSLCAFITPRSFPKRLRLLASHTDSPSLKLKPQPEVRRNDMILLGVEIYGSPLLTSWLNRDLGIAGRVIYTDRLRQIKESLVRLDRYPVTIPQLALHLDREVNDKGVFINKQEHLNVLAGLEYHFKSNFSFLETILGEVIDFEQIIAHDLFLFPLEKAQIIGFQHSLLAAYRIDNLASVHAVLTAILDHSRPLEDEIKMVIFWDHEEVGSQTAQGVYSPFFSQILERILERFKGTKEDYFCLLNRSTCISVDLAHALHPNYIYKHDPQHQPVLGKGIVIKSNAQQRYATNAYSSVPIKIAAAFKQLPLQTFVSRNDIPCGTTIGPIQASLTGMSTVDIGCGQLSMHSCRELMACQDHIDMCCLLGELLQTRHWPQIIS